MGPQERRRVGDQKADAQDWKGQAGAELRDRRIVDGRLGRMMHRSPLRCRRAYILLALSLTAGCGPCSTREAPAPVVPIQPAESASDLPPKAIENPQDPTQVGSRAPLDDAALEPPASSAEGPEDDDMAPDPAPGPANRIEDKISELGERKTKIIEDALGRIDGRIAAATEPSTRGRALLDKARLLRQRKDDAAAETAFRDALTLLTLDEGDGRDAASELAALLRGRGDHIGALELYEKVTAHPRVEPERRVQLLYATGISAEAAGDRRRARAAVQRIVDDYADEPKFDNAVRKAREWLDRNP